MKSDADILVTLASHFALLSLFTVGGGMAAVPEIQRLVVESKDWMSGREFADLFAIAQISPGPNVLLVTLIGYHVAGLPGAAVTTVAICGPTCFAAYWVSRVWDRFKGARWRLIIQAAMVPVSLGLFAASAFVISFTAVQGWIALAIMVAAFVAALRTQLNPLWIFAAGALLGLVGLA